MGAMPALMQRDFAAFGAAITAIQQNVGAYFAPAQGGVFTSRRVERADRAAVRGRRDGLGAKLLGPYRLHLCFFGGGGTWWCAEAVGDDGDGTELVSCAAAMAALRSNARSRSGCKLGQGRFSRGAPALLRRKDLARKHILHMLTPLKQMSPFDVNMALDAGFDAVVPYITFDLAKSPVWFRTRSSRGRRTLASTRACSSPAKTSRWRSTCSMRRTSRWCRLSRFRFLPIRQAPSPLLLRWWPRSKRRWRRNSTAA